MIRRRRGVFPSKVDKAIREMVVGQKIEVEGSISHWRNRQANFHRENPDKWVTIYRTENGAIAERIQ